MSRSNSSLAYFNALKDAFLPDENDKFEEFFNIVADYLQSRIDRARAIARGNELMKDHPQLIPGFLDYLSGLPDAPITNPPEASTIPLTTDAPISDTAEASTIPLPLTTDAPISDTAEASTIPLPLTTDVGRDEYIKSVSDAFKSDLPKTIAFNKLLGSMKSQSVDSTNVKENMEKLRENMEKLLNDHPRLLPGINSLFLEANKTINPEADGGKFMNMLKKTYEGCDTDNIVESVNEILRKLKEGNISKEDAYSEVVDLIYFQDELWEELSTYMTEI